MIDKYLTNEFFIGFNSTVLIIVPIIVIVYWGMADFVFDYADMLLDRMRGKDTLPTVYNIPSTSQPSAPVEKLKPSPLSITYSNP